jgi:hypothetical protein
VGVARDAAREGGAQGSIGRLLARSRAPALDRSANFPSSYINKEKDHLDKVMCHCHNPPISNPIEERMAHDVISTCPVCSGELAVTRLRCSSCGTTLEGEFSVGRFARLSRDQMALLESFLRSRGNLRDIERELGISYPTVRARVEALVRALGFGPRADDDAAAGDEPAAPTPAPTREAILERLARREITAEDAALAIRALGRNRA